MRLAAAICIVTGNIRRLIGIVHCALARPRFSLDWLGCGLSSRPPFPKVRLLPFSKGVIMCLMIPLAVIGAIKVLLQYVFSVSLTTIAFHTPLGTQGKGSTPEDAEAFFVDALEKWSEAKVKREEVGRSAFPRTTFLFGVRLVPHGILSLCSKLQWVDIL